jgi:hypothetical protein
LALLNAFKAACERRGLTVGTPVCARYARVWLEDEIGAEVNAKVAVILLGERPGLGTISNAVVIALALCVLLGAATADTFALLGAAAYGAMRLLPLANGSAWLVWRAQSGATSALALADLPTVPMASTRRPRASCGADVVVDDVGRESPAPRGVAAWSLVTGLD